jgi:A/G-specific adenine glycosylase
MQIATPQKKYFTRQLMDWHATANHRSLPWKKEKDPYKIWLSEVILQQTRALQGLPYYLRFTEAYPTIQDMASAADDDVFRLWQGLGYYNRCKNMLATARYIAHDLNGHFPDTYEGLLQLKGIGPYTAAAIASFAYGLPHAVVDGNVYRVLARYFGIDTPFDTNEGKIVFRSLAEELLDTRDSAAYNQAIMDMGATVCTPALPLCNECPLQQNCIAYHQQLITYLPVRSKKITVRNRYFHYILLLAGDTVWVHKRTGKDIWENLNEPYLIEHTDPLDTATLVQHDLYRQLNLLNITPEYEGLLKQRLTHQLIETRFFSIQLDGQINVPVNEGNWIAMNELKKIAFPKTLVSFLEKKLYF